MQKNTAGVFFCLRRDRDMTGRTEPTASGPRDLPGFALRRARPGGVKLDSPWSTECLLDALAEIREEPGDAAARLGLLGAAFFLETVASGGGVLATVAAAAGAVTVLNPCSPRSARRGTGR